MLDQSKAACRFSIISICNRFMDITSVGKAKQIEVYHRQLKLRRTCISAQTKKYGHAVLIYSRITLFWAVAGWTHRRSKIRLCHGDVSSVDALARGLSLQEHTS